MADTRSNYISARPADIRRYARSLAYLGSVDKMRAALANEFGADRPLPSTKVLQGMLDERCRTPRSVHFLGRAA